MKSRIQYYFELSDSCRLFSNLSIAVMSSLVSSHSAALIVSSISDGALGPVMVDVTSYSWGLGQWIMYMSMELRSILFKLF